MRISITGEKNLIDSLQHELATDPSIKPEVLSEKIDHTELAFGFSEVSAIVGAFVSVAKLVEYLVTFAKAHSGKKPQILKLKSAFGVVTVELREGITAEELQQQLKTLERPV